ncbi:MAG: DUF1778 domain-containing protein [Burkholderiales bacterium]
MHVATVSTAAAPRRDTLNLRIPAAERNLIDRAAACAGTTRTEFILRAARRAAEETLLDQAVLAVSPEAYAEFLARLDAPTAPNERLRRTMQMTPPWAKD